MFQADQPATMIPPLVQSPAATLRQRAEVYGNQPAGNFLVYGPKEAAEDIAAAKEMDRLRQAALAA